MRVVCAIEEKSAAISLIGVLKLSSSSEQHLSSVNTAVYYKIED